MVSPAHPAQDPARCYLGITAGSGEPEARAFAEMLGVMYRGFAARRGWDVVVLDHETADGGL